MPSEDGQCFTRVPNLLLDQAMAHMGNAELRVVLAVMRKTIGWNKQRDRISLTQFEEMTGLARQHVIRGIRDAVNNCWVRQWKLGRITSYELSLEAGNEKLPVADHGEKIIGNETLPMLVTESYHISNEKSPKLVTESYTQKKGKKTKKERKEISSNASVEAIETPPIAVLNSHDEQQIQEKTKAESITDAPAQETSVRPERARKPKLTENEAARHRELFDAIAQLCVLDAKLAGGMIARTAKLLREADAVASGADLAAFRDWWKTSDWRGRTGQPPTPQQVVNSWLQFRQGYATRIDSGKDTGYVDRMRRIYDEA